MKKHFKSIVLSGLLSVCFIASYAQGSIYLSEAMKNPFERNIFIDEQGDTFRYSAFYKGQSAPAEDIQITFSVDSDKIPAYNTAHGTAYKPLPVGCYTLSATCGVIPQDAVLGTPGEIRVVGKGFLKPFEKYLLPVSVNVVGDAVRADSEYSTIYYILQAVPAPGTIARKQIARLPSGTKSVFGLGDKYLIAAGANGALTAYHYSRGACNKEQTMKSPESIREMEVIVGFRDHHLIGLYRKAGNGQLWSFPVSGKSPEVGECDKIFGTSGYNIFSDIICSGTNLYCRKPGGELMIYPLTETLEWAGAGVRSLGGGWSHSVIFCYGDSLFAVNGAGDLWKFTLSETGLPGLPAKIGSGWNRYKCITAVGNDLIVLDNEHILWRIEFDAKGFWAL